MWKVFSFWESKIQDVTPSPHSKCFTHGANNIEKKLSNEMYRLWHEIPRIRKRMYRFHLVLEEMIELTQNENISYSSNVPGLTLKVSMPPPDYFNNVNWDEYSVEEVEHED